MGNGHRPLYCLTTLLSTPMHDAFTVIPDESFRLGAHIKLLQTDNTTEHCAARHVYSILTETGLNTAIKAYPPRLNGGQEALPPGELQLIYRPFALGDHDSLIISAPEERMSVDLEHVFNARRKPQSVHASPDFVDLGYGTLSIELWFNREHENFRDLYAQHDWTMRNERMVRRAVKR